MLALKKISLSLFFSVLLMTAPSYIYSNDHEPFFDSCMKAALTENHPLEKSIEKTCNKNKTFTYYLDVDDFIASFIEIPTSNVLDSSSTKSSSYLAGRAAVYNLKNKKVGTCSASFLCIENRHNIFTDISNYLSIDNGLIVSWLTPSTLENLELDSIVHSMVTECLVTASTKIGENPFYGKKFNMIVSSKNGKIYFKLQEI